MRGTKSRVYMSAGQGWVKPCRKRPAIRQRAAKFWDRRAGEDMVSPLLEGFQDGNDLGGARGQASLPRSLPATSFMLL